MTKLTTASHQSLPATMTGDVTSAAKLMAESKAAATRRAYAADWRSFARYCEQHGMTPRPASPDIVAAYLAAEFQKGKAPSTLGRRLAAIKLAHESAGLDSPTRSALVSATMGGIRRTRGSAPAKKAAATADIVSAMLSHVPHGIAGVRDRALLLLGFAGAFRRSELVALTLEDVEFTDEGLRITIRRSKTDQEGRGQVIAIPDGPRLRAGRALREWITAAGIDSGPLFRQIRRGGHVQRGGLSDRTVATLVKRYAEASGLDQTHYSGHSLRSGFITSAAEHGASLLKMAEVSRHRSLEVLRGYVRSAELFKDHAGAGFL